MTRIDRRPPVDKRRVLLAMTYRRARSAAIDRCSVPTCGDVGPHLREHCIESAAIEKPAADDHRADPLSIADVFERVAVEKYQVGDLAGLDSTQRVLHPEEFGRISRCGVALSDR